MINPKSPCLVLANALVDTHNITQTKAPALSGPLVFNIYTAAKLGHETESLGSDPHE